MTDNRRAFLPDIRHQAGDGQTAHTSLAGSHAGTAEALHLVRAGAAARSNRPDLAGSDLLATADDGVIVARQ